VNSFEESPDCQRSRLRQGSDVQAFYHCKPLLDFIFRLEGEASGYGKSAFLLLS
jgi:hypothetical protein